MAESLVREVVFANTRYAEVGNIIVVPGKEEYLYIKTAPAACVLPVDGEGNVYLIRQHRPEGGGTFVKTVGGYLAEGESDEDCLVRNLKNKAGIVLLVPKEKALRYQTRNFGIGPVVKTPIRHYLLLPGSWKVDSKGSCELVKLSREEACAIVDDNEVYDDCTRLQILHRLAGLG